MLSRKERLIKLREKYARCRRCELYKKRTRVVFGQGSIKPKVVFVGEAPGANEDIQGVPFVGRSGALLRKLIKEAGIERFYITNTVLCRPPRNRTPFFTEVEACNKRLRAQIAILKPESLVLVGATAYRALTSGNVDFATATRNSYTLVLEGRGERVQVGLYVIYHPAYLLRKGAKGREYDLTLETLKEAAIDSRIKADRDGILSCFSFET